MSVAEAITVIAGDFSTTAAGVWTGVFMFGAWFVREWRETSKMSSADKLARREGYAKQVESLAVENRALRAELFAARKEHDDYRTLCHRETDQLRKEVLGLINEVEGMRR